MADRPRRVLGLLSILIVLPATPAARAEPLRPADVPAPLKPWVDWALRGHETERCPLVAGGGDEDKHERRCAWGGRLELALDGRGGRFKQEWDVTAPTDVALPGSADRWPVDVKVDGKPAIVLGQGGAPVVRLPPGRHQIAGAFAWQELPESLEVPREWDPLESTCRHASLSIL